MKKNMPITKETSIYLIESIKLIRTCNVSESTVHRKDLEFVFPNNRLIVSTCQHVIWQEQIQSERLMKVYEGTKSNLYSLIRIDVFELMKWSVLILQQPVSLLQQMKSKTLAILELNMSSR